jgi:hypothetical protein
VANQKVVDVKFEIMDVEYEIEMTPMIILQDKVRPYCVIYELHLGYQQHLLLVQVFALKELVNQLANKMLRKVRSTLYL